MGQWTETDRTELGHLITLLERDPPISDNVLQQLQAWVTATYGTSLPKDYVDLLRIADGADGDLESGAPILFWKAELLNEVNADFDVDGQMPGLLVIGSDAGDLVYGIDLRQDAPRERYIETEDASMAWDYILWQGRTVLDLLQHLNRNR